MGLRRWSAPALLLLLLLTQAMRRKRPTVEGDLLLLRWSDRNIGAGSLKLALLRGELRPISREGLQT